MATLRALEVASVPQQPPSLPGSDSEEEEEVVETKKKRTKKGLFAGASSEVEEKKGRRNVTNRAHLAVTPRKRKWKGRSATKGVLLGSDLAEEEKKEEMPETDPFKSCPAPLDSVDQTGSICGMMRAGVWDSADPTYNRVPSATSRCGVRE